jgi:hypothetical protein
MIKKLTWVACFLIVFGGSAIATHAQTSVDPFAGDSHVILNGPPDPCGDDIEQYCVDLTYSGSGTTFFYLSSATPLPEPPPDTCASNDFRCTPISLPCLPLSLKEECFYGFLFYDYEYGKVPDDTSFFLYTNVPITLSLAGTDLACSGTGCGPNPEDVTFTPEPGTALLYMTGLALLVGLGRKRFRANCLT